MISLPGNFFDFFHLASINLNYPRYLSRQSVTNLMSNNSGTRTDNTYSAQIKKKYILSYIL